MWRSSYGAGRSTRNPAVFQLLCEINHYALPISSILLDPNLLVALTALIISVIALLYTVRTYLLKRGHKIRCNYSTAGSWDAQDAYIADVTIENLKDRATVIFNIYMHFRANVYLEIESFEGSPLILQPFGVYHKQYDPVLLYANGMDRMLMDDLINSKTVRKRLVLNTTDGKIIARVNISRWSPITLFFRNYFTNITRPNRLAHKGKSYGPLVRYLIVLRYKNGPEEIVPLQLKDHQIKKFSKFKLTEECLESADSIRRFLEQKRAEGLLSAESIEVLDYGTQVDATLKEFKETQKAIAIGWWQYRLLGWWHTRREDRKIDTENKTRLRKQKK